MTDDVSFGKWLRQRRRMLDMTQQDLADQVGCARITLRRIENDALKPSRELAWLLLQKMGIPEGDRPEWVQFARKLAEFPTRPPEPPANRLLTNLPAFLTSFIGRKKEQSEIIKLNYKHRLVTLTGLGGVGKTHLSLKVGEQLLADFSDGVWLVELGALNNPDLIPHTVAQVFGLMPSPNKPLVESLVNFLRAKSVLLILDNCEHLLDACARLADILLKSCSKLKILTTSREALGITGEATYHVPSLELPYLHAQLETFRECESVQLFEERAQLAQNDFVLTKKNAPFIDQICRRLDGIPLAIELAAARVNVFSAEQIAVQLDECLQLLAGGSRTALPRQQTIRASIEWSWNLLTEAEQILLRRLSVFTGGWTLESAQAVCGQGGLKSTQVMDLNCRLAKKSLIIVDQESWEERRYHLHEVVHQFAREKLDEAGESSLIQGLHLQYFFDFAVLPDKGLAGAEQVEWYSRALDDRDNLRAALEYAAKYDEVETGLILSSSLARSFWERYDVQEGLNWLTRFLQNPKGSNYPRALAKGLYVQGGLLCLSQRFGEARSRTEEALALCHAMEDKHGEIEALLTLGDIMQYLENMDRKVEIQLEALALAQSIGDVQEEARSLAGLGWEHRDVQFSHRCWNRAIELFRQAGDWCNLAYYLSVLGHSLVMEGEGEKARKLLDEASEINQKTRARREMEFVLTSFGQLALIEGNYTQARFYFQENTGIMTEVGNRLGYLWGRARLGYAILRQGYLDEARDILIHTLQDFYHDGNREGITYVLMFIASLFAVVGKPLQAACVIGWQDAELTRIGDAHQPVEQMSVERDIAMIKNAVGDKKFEVAYNEGCAMTLEQIILCAME